LLAAGVPLVLLAPRRDGATVAGTAAIAVAYVIFSAAFLLMTRRKHDVHSAASGIALLTVQSLCAFVVAGLLHSGFEGIFLVVVAAQLVFAVPVRAAIVWTAAQTAVFFALQALHTTPLSALIQATAYAGFSAFALYAG